MVQLVSRGGPRILQTQVSCCCRATVADAISGVTDVVAVAVTMLLLLMQDGLCVLLLQLR